MRHSARRRDRFRTIVTGVVATLVGLATLVALPVSTAYAAAGLSVVRDADAEVLVGGVATVRLTARNPGDAPLYNLSFREALPAGVTYVAGSTTPDTLGEPQVLTQAGRQTLIWSNVSDLPAAAEQPLTLRVRAASATYPVNSTFDAGSSAYANTDPRTVPRFSATGDYASGATHQQAAGADPTRVTAIAVAKSEPSPEHELRRGVHDHSTTYTLEVTNNTVNPTTGVVLEDFLPADLEFLGCGTVDNTPGDAVEYLGAPRLDVSTPPVAPCRTANRVETVSNPAGLPSGVYTKVTWNLGAMSAGQTVRVVYAAGIPQRANTTTFPGSTPTPASLGQAANLANNTGPATRETGTERALTNRAVVSGTYTGPVRSGSSTAVTARDELTVTAEDLAIQKSVAPGTTFSHGGVATFTLHLQTGEYAETSGIEITDVIPNGMCPLGAAGTNYAAGSPAECDGSAGDAPDLPFDRVTERPDGTFQVVFDPIDLGANQTRTISYRVGMLSNYRTGTTDPTVVGDGYRNTVSLTAQSTTLDDVGAPGGVTTVPVQDASEAAVSSQALALDKRIQPNIGSAYTCSDDAASYADAATLPAAQRTFSKGSRVCFLLRVTFPAGNATKNPVLTDFLPDYLAYEPGSVHEMTQDNTVTASFDEASTTFTLGDASGGNRFVAPGAVFAYRIAGTVTRPSGSTTPDVTGNLAKLRWTNTGGTVGFLRDREDFSIAPPPPLAVTKSAERTASASGGAVGSLPDNDTTAARRIRAGDEVRYAVRVENSSAVGVFGLDLWDRLPVGLTCADVSAITDGGQCTDPGAGTHPSFTGSSTRSAIRWSFSDLVPILPGHSFFRPTYTVRYPATVAAGGTYRNDVDVASYGTRTNTGTVVRHYPAQNVDTSVTAGMVDAPVAHDDHTLRAPAMAVTKTNVTSVPDAEQGSGAGSLAAIGETVIYELIATFPAHTTVYAGVLADALPTGLEAVSYDYSFRRPGGTWGSSLAGSTRVAGPPAAAQVALPAAMNTGAEDLQARIVVTARVPDLQENRRDTVRTNTATLTARSGPGSAPALTPLTAGSDVRVVEPAPAPLKTVDKPAPGAEQTVTFTVTARNRLAAAGTQVPPLYGALLVDCIPAALDLLPATVQVSVGTATVAALGAEGCGPGETPLVWQVGDLAWRADQDAWPTLTYDVRIDPAAAGGRTYTNTATLGGTSMPGTVTGERSSYSATANAAVTVPSPALAKTAAPTRATIGEPVTYTVRTTIPADVNLFDAMLVDTVPAGLDIDSVSIDSIQCTYEGSPGEPCDISDRDHRAYGQAYGIFLGDIEDESRARVLTVTYSAVVDDVATNVAGAAVTNSARLHWNHVSKHDDQESPPTPTSTFDASSTPGTATVTVIEPDLSVAKAVDDATPAPGETFEYTVRVSNPATDNISDAYAVEVTDVVPAGVRVDPDSISHGGTLANGTTGGGTITWLVPGPIERGGHVALTYEATLISPAPAAAQVNTATVEEYHSGDPSWGGVRTYTKKPSATATATPALPRLTVDKGALDSRAYLGSPARWRITVTNAGTATAYDVDVTDTLPDDWTYDAASARVAVAGGTPAAVEPTISGATLTWTNVGHLAPAQKVVVVLSATPDPSLAPSRVGASVSHRNEATATAQDLDGAAGHVVTTADDDASTTIDSADLVLEKTGQAAPVAGARTSWTLSVSNDGPDAAVGPFTVTDTVPAPVTGVAASGTGWTCPTPAAPADSDDGTEVTCTRAGTLASGGSFPPITVTGTLPDDTAAGTTLTNTAAVTGLTHDPDADNNADTHTGTSTVVSDMSVAKSLTGTLVPGRSATYRIAVTNHGPSVAHGDVVVTDTLPAGLTYDSFTGTDWDLERSGQRLELTWTGDTPVPVGAMGAIDVTVAVDSGVTGAVANTASVTEPSDPTTEPEEPDTDTDTTTAGPSADLAVEKSAPTVPKAGEKGVYRLVVTNHGPSDAAGPILVQDMLPAGITFDSADSDDPWVCTESAGRRIVNCVLADGLTDGVDSTLELTVDVAENLTGNVVNTATVSGATTDPVPSNNTDSHDSGVEVEADLSLTKTLQTSTVVAGEHVTYRLVVRNEGPATSPGPLTVTDSLPEGIAFVSASGTGWACEEEDGVVGCERAASLAADTDAPAITVVGTVGSGVGTTTLVNTAGVDGPADDPTPADTTDTADTPVTEVAEVEVEKRVVGSATVLAGSEVRFALEVANTGPSDARSVTVTDTLPAGMTLVSATGAGWTCEDGACTRDRVAAGTSAPVITVVALVAAGTPDGATLTNRVAVSTVTAGDTPAGNTDEVDLEVETEADLELTKSHPDGTAVVAGETTTYRLAVRNLGPSDAVGPLTVRDTLPAGLGYLSAAAPWTCAVDDVDEQEVTCTLAGDRPAGAPIPALSMQVAVRADQNDGTVTNTATVSSATTDPVPANDASRVDVDVERQADVSVAKSHTGPVKVGERLAFTLEVHNAGPSEAREVVVTDRLPAGLDLVSADGTGWTCSTAGGPAAGTAACELDDPLAPGEDADPITVVTTVTAAAYPSVSNAATVSTSTTDPEPANDESTDAVTVPALVDLAVEKTLRGTLVVGQQGRYRVEVTNHGPTAAPGPITVTDDLPDGLRLVRASGADWTCAESSGEVTCTRGRALPVGGSAVVDLVVEVLPAAYPTVENTAVVSSGSEDTDPANDRDAVREPVTPTVELSLTKTAVAATATEMVYEITVTNRGPSDTVRPIRVVDPLPRTLRLSEARAGDWACETGPRRAMCTYADPLPAGESVGFRLVTEVRAAPGEEILNVARVLGSSTGTSTEPGRDVAGSVKVVVPEDDGAGADQDDPDAGSGGGLLPDAGGPSLLLLGLGLTLAAAGLAVLRRRRRA